MTGADRRLGALCELGSRLAAVTGFEEVVDVTLIGLEELLGYGHSLLLVHQVESDRLVTLASRGYQTGGIGSEVAVGDGVIGMAAKRRGPMRVGNLQRMLRYARTVQRNSTTAATPGSEIQLPGLPDARSQLAAPMIARGALIGVVAVESPAALAFDDIDEQILVVVAHLVGAGLDREYVAAADPDVVTMAGPESRPERAGQPAQEAAACPPGVTIRLRHYVADGSTFIDGTYLIKGVAGRLLWKVAAEYVNAGRTSFTNREARLDPTLELPAFRDNFESRLILLKRRLEERGTPLRITDAGRGCFGLVVDAPISLERVEPN